MLLQETTERELREVLDRMHYTCKMHSPGIVRLLLLVANISVAPFEITAFVC